MTVDWDYVRSTFFPGLDKNKLLYFMAASASPLNKKSYEEGINYFTEMLNYGDLHHEKFGEDIELARNWIAEYINAKPEEIALLVNTSSGMTTIAKMFQDDKKEVLYPSIEFPTSIHIFKRMGFPCKKIFDNNNIYTLDSITERISEKTGYLVHSYVQSLTGFKQDLDKIGELCNERRLISIINATQAFGAFELDVKKSKIDIVVSNGLKWLACGYGIGILYIPQKLIQDKFLPFTGWLSVEDPFGMDNDNLRVLQETKSMTALGGCPNVAALLSLKGGLELVKEEIGQGDIRKGVKLIQERIINLTSQLITNFIELDLRIITPIDIKNRSGIITIEHEQASKIHELLVQKNVYTSLKRYPQSDKDTLLRFAINYYNNFEDIVEASRILGKNIKEL